MSLRRKRILAGVGIVGLIVFLWTLFLPRQPVHDGRTLSSWLVDLDNPTKRPLAMEAIQLMGTNAMPMILEELRATEPKSKWQRDLKGWVAKQSWCPIDLPSALLRRDRASSACYVLGPQARSALEPLEELIGDPHGYLLQGLYANSLSVMGNDGVAVLFRHLDKPGRNPPQILEQAIVSGAGVESIPTLEAILASRAVTNAHVREVAVEVMERLYRSIENRDDYVRGAIDAITNKSRGARAVAVTLGRFSGHARAAIPALQAATKDPDPQIRVAARMALVRIEVGATNVPAPIEQSILNARDLARISDLERQVQYFRGKLQSSPNVHNATNSAGATPNSELTLWQASLKAAETELAKLRKAHAKPQ